MINVILFSALNKQSCKQAWSLVFFIFFVSKGYRSEAIGYVIAELPRERSTMAKKIWLWRRVRPPVRTDAGGEERESDVSPSGEEYVIAEVKFSISSNSLVSVVNHMAARSFGDKKKQEKRVFLSTKF